MRLTNQEIQLHKHKLSLWCPPDEMVISTDALIDVFDDEDLFNQPGIMFVREAWIAGHYGRVRDAKFARLIGEERPDFSLQFNAGDTENYEPVEADTPGRNFIGVYPLILPSPPRGRRDKVRENRALFTAR